LKDGLAEAVRRAPWTDSWVTIQLQQQYKGEPPAAALLQAYAKVLDYDLAAMATVANGLHDDDDELERLAGRICDIDVERCASYAEYLSTVFGRDQAAEKMWKRGLAGAQDQIGLSNSLGGYVNLLLDRGQTDEALRIARRAADVYSGTGLFTLALALERLGRFDEAAREYAKITQRYGSKDRENTFYVRYGQRYGGERFARESQLALAELFPKGLVRKTVEDFRQQSHQGGVMGYKHDERLRRLGIHDDDFVTAVDGFVIENQKQMSAVLTFTDDPKMTVIVMRQKGEGKGWLELAGQYRRWKYGPVKR
jgi:tetratricopeptide (TPR) repeat protein